MANLEEIEQLARKARGSVDKIYLHWSAGHYNSVFDDYHVNIKGDGELVVTGEFTETKAHTWKRNTGSVGVSLCCAYNATSADLGEEPPTTEQIEKMAQVIAVIAKGLDIPIDKYHVLTHGEAADNLDGEYKHENYGACTTVERWDLQYLGTDESPMYIKDYDDPRTGGNVLRGKANFYLNQMNGETSQTQSKTSQTQNGELPEVKIWKFFKGKGLNDFAVAGIIGNLYAESGLISTNLQNNFEDALGSDEEYTAKVDSGEYGKEEFMHDSAGYGLAQWTYYTRKEALYDYAKNKGVSIGDLDMQLEFLWSELIYYDALMHRLHDAKSVREASDALLLDFERPADQGEGQRSRRAEYSQEFYEDYAAKIEGEENSVVTEKRYNTVEELPEWAKGTIERMIQQKILNGDGEKLDLSKDMLRMLVIIERMRQR